MKRNIIRVFIAALVLAALGAGLWYYLSPDEVQVITAKRGSVSPVLQGTGKIEGNRKVTVYSDVSGMISGRYVETGDRITKGMILLDYAGESQQDQVEYAENDVEFAEKILGSASDSRAAYQSKVKDAEARIENCKQVYALLEVRMLALKSDNYESDYALQQQKKVYESDITKLEEEVSEKQSDIAKVEADIKAMELKEEHETDKIDELRDRSKDYQDDIKDINEKISRLKRDEICLPSEGMDPETYDKYIVLENNLDTVMRLWTEAKNDKDTAQAMVTAYKEIYADEQEVEKDRITLDHAERELERAKAGTLAPSDGIITACLVDVGAYVEKGAPVIEMQTANGYKVNMLVSKYDIAYVHEGQEADVRIGANGYKGRVIRINQTAENDASGKAKAGVEIEIDTDDDLIVGLDADVALTLDSAMDVLTVPNDCIYTDDDGSFLYVIMSGEVVKQYVTTGIRDNANTEVSGIDESIHIVSDPDAGDYLDEEIEEVMETGI